MLYTSTFASAGKLELITPLVILEMVLFNLLAQDNETPP